jgi:hypothetical protein
MHKFIALLHCIDVSWQTDDSHGPRFQGIYRLSERGYLFESKTND